MIKWFIEGGTLFMSILTILLVILVAVTVYFAITIASGKASVKRNFKHQLKYVRSIGLFTLVTGILGQMIGLFQAFTVIQSVQDISPSILAGGLKVSMITSLTGIFIYLVSIVLWFLLDLWYHKKAGPVVS
jgi:putative Mn2+ efflux pump MntP